MTCKVFCDRCNTEIRVYDERMTDLLRNEYPGKNICSNCDLEIVLASTAVKKDIELKQKPGTTLKLMLERYNECPN